ncbi:cytochrome c biogenesis protein CCS1 (chloroplast) [Gracilaria domingensis]|uniref:Cytochrome c biogenesis protein n=1 Tax=Gracilaria domingensis TaxID=172961 RepID=UPI001D113D8F|nr:Cytochrome c biogenesis protein [Gracilaria domingensis]KAI0556391.1 cytochrome c biogenesis protein CCS1 [Gracilaria domingensis]UAD85297.1 Cytochrome c biogenesis protein [Gracilaria domingensis]
MQLLNTKNIIWHTFKKLRNLSFSISLLLIIAIISIIGTIIEQNQSISYYQTNYPLNNQLLNDIINWKIIVNLGLDHIYSNPCFITVLILFFCSLLSCTFSNQLPSLRNARKWKFLQHSQKRNNKSHFTELDQTSICNMIYSLYSNHYYIFHKETSLYAYKGLSGRIAPIIVHFSIILTLTGSVISLLGGFTAQEIVPEGEIFHIKNTIQSGFNSTLPDNLIGKINDFHITYNKDNSIKQFLSNIALYNSQGHNINQKYVFVNSPLIFNGITFYQTDWSINSIRLKIGNSKIIQHPITKHKINNQILWSSQIPINKTARIIFIVTKLNNQISMYDTSNNLLIHMKSNEKVVINNTTVEIVEIMTNTGLQIKTDPGIFITYTGFLTLMISIIVSYISYSQIWVNSIIQNIEIAGFTNRATLSFEEDLINIEEIYTKYTWI